MQTSRHKQWHRHGHSRRSLRHSHGPHSNSNGHTPTPQAQAQPPTTGTATVARPPHAPGSDAHHLAAILVIQQLRGRRGREDVHAQFLGLLAQPRGKLAEADDVVALVVQQRDGGALDGALCSSRGKNGVGRGSVAGTEWSGVDWHPSHVGQGSSLSVRYSITSSVAGVFSCSDKQRDDASTRHTKRRQQRPRRSGSPAGRATTRVKAYRRALVLPVGDELVERTGLKAVAADDVVACTCDGVTPRVVCHMPGPQQRVQPHHRARLR